MIHKQEIACRYCPLGLGAGGQERRADEELTQVPVGFILVFVRACHRTASNRTTDSFACAFGIRPSCNEPYGCIQRRTDIIQTTNVISQMPQVMRVRVVRFLLGDCLEKLFAHPGDRLRSSRTSGSSGSATTVSGDDEAFEGGRGSAVRAQYHTDEELIDHICSVIVPVMVPSGSYLYQAGDRADGLYVYDCDDHRNDHIPSSSSLFRKASTRL